VWHVLEESVTLVLANAMHIRNVPGRKLTRRSLNWQVSIVQSGDSMSREIRP